MNTTLQKKDGLTPATVDERLLSFAERLPNTPLTSAEAEELVISLSKTEVSPLLVRQILLTLAQRGETPEEIIGFRNGLRRLARPFPQAPEDALDVCGTGGDGLKTFNISSAVALLTAAAGIPTVKHGNRAVSGQSGSADVFEALGIKTRFAAQEAALFFKRFNFVFLYAPDYYPTLKNLAAIRKSLKQRTIFNLLGPLLNPASVKRQLIGVYSAATLEKMAEVLAKSPEETVKRALVLHSQIGMDEAALLGKTDIALIEQRQITCFSLIPDQLGIASADFKALTASSPEESAGRIEAVFRKQKGPATDIVALNTALAFMAAGMASSPEAGLASARELLASDRPERFLQTLREASK